MQTQAIKSVDLYTFVQIYTGGPAITSVTATNSTAGEQTGRHSLQGRDSWSLVGIRWHQSDVVGPRTGHGCHHRSLAALQAPEALVVRGIRFETACTDIGSSSLITAP